MTQAAPAPKLPPLAAGILESLAARQPAAVVVSTASFDVPTGQRLDSHALASTSGPPDATPRPNSRGKALPPLLASAATPMTGTGAPARGPSDTGNAPRSAHDRLGTLSVRTAGKAGVLLEAVTADAFATAAGAGEWDDHGPDGMHGVRGAHVSAAALERALSQVVSALDPLGDPGPSPPLAPLHRLGLSREALGQAGVPADIAERIHRLLYVSTVGFGASLSAALRPCRHRSSDVMRRIVTGYLALACASLRHTFHSEVLALAELTSAQAAELHDRLERLAQAYTDQSTLERALASVVSAHAEEVSRNRALTGQLENVQATVEDLDKRYAMTRHQYIAEAQHRADLQAEVASLRQRVASAEATAQECREGERRAEESLLKFKSETEAELARVPGLEEELARERGLREAAEDRLSSLSSTNERSEWRQRVTHARFQEEMGAKGAMQERVLKAERGLTEATGELARLREEHRKLGRVYEELLTEGAGLRASVSRLEFERERLVGANRELETKGIEMQEALERKREKKRAYKAAASELRGSRDSAVEQIEHLRSQLQSVTKERQAAGRECERAMGEARGLRDHLRSVTLGFTHAVRALRANQTARRYLQRRVAELSAGWTAANTRLVGVERRLEGQVAECARLRDTLSELEKDLQAASQRASDAEDNARRLEAALAEAEGRLRLGRDDFATAQERLEEAKRGSEALEATLATLRRQLEERAAELQAARDRADAAERELSTVRGTVATMKIEKTQMQGQLQAGRQTIRDLQSKVAEEQTRVKDGLAREAALKATVADLERQLRGATGRGDGLQTLLDEQRRLLEEEKRLRAADVERLLAVQAAVSDELEKTREDLKREVEGRGEDVQWREEEMARLRAVLAKQAEEIEEKKKTIEARDKRIQELRDRIEKQNGALEDLRERLDEERERNERLNEQKVYFESQVSSIKAANDHLNDRHVMDEEEIRRLQGMLVEEGKVLASSQEEQEHAVAKARQQAELASRARMLSQETKWLSAMRRAVEDLRDREKGYDALQRLFKAVELSVEDMGGLAKGVRDNAEPEGEERGEGGAVRAQRRLTDREKDRERFVSLLLERVDVVRADLEKAKEVRMEFNRPKSARGYQAMLKESQELVEELGGRVER